MLTHVANILEIGDAIAHTEDRNTYIELRKAEAHATALLLEDCATPATRADPHFQEFMYAITGLGIGANMLDSLLDAKVDYIRGRSKLVPTRHLYLSLGKDALNHTRPHIMKMLNPPAIKSRFEIMMGRVIHRITHGITPESSLQSHLLNYFRPHKP